MLIARQMRSYAWNDGKELHIGRDSLVMGVLNITDDSFSDGGKWNTLETAMKHAKHRGRINKTGIHVPFGKG